MLFIYDSHSHSIGQEMESSHAKTHPVHFREKEGLQVAAGVLDEAALAKAAPLIKPGAWLTRPGQERVWL